MTYPQRPSPSSAPKCKWIVLGLFLLALTLFSHGLGNPPRFYWDENIHVNAARTIFDTQASGRYHPPLGRELLYTSLQLFGDSPAGARGLSAMAGAGGIALIFLIARRLTQNTTAGLFTALLLLAEPLYYLHSRIGMLDMFLTFFMILSFWIFLKIRQQEPGQRSLYLYYCLGTALGLAFSVKTLASVLYPIFLLDRLVAASKISDPREKKLHFFHLLLAFSLPTLLIFWGSYAILGYSLPEIKGHLAQYYHYMSTFKGEQAIVSKWYEWLIVKMAIWYLKVPVDETHSLAIVAIGNHLIWIGAELCFIALLFCWRWVRREVYFLHLIIVAQFAFWGIKPATHLYYMLPVVPFYALLIGVFFQFLMDRFPAKKKYIQFDTAVFLLCAFAVFAYYFPLLRGTPLETTRVERFIFPGIQVPAADSRASQTP